MANLNEYDEGNVIRVTGTFRNAVNALADPTVIVVKYRKPNGTITTATLAAGQVIKETLGVFYHDINTTGGPVGRWAYKFYATGAVVASGEWAFMLKQTSF